MGDSKYVEQFKCIEDISEYINQLIEEHRNRKQQKLGIMFRVVIPPNDPTLYKESPYKLVEGVRICDYHFDTATNCQWVLPDPQAGLSFSRTFSHLKNTRKMLARHAKGRDVPGPADVAWWILESNPIPEGMAFVQDEKSKNHYFLAVVGKPMHISTLISNLRTVAQKMAIVKDISYGDR